MTDNKTYHRSVKYTQTRPPVSDYFDTFINMNPNTGYLVFEVHEDSPVRGRIPIENAKITISKLLGDGYYFSKIVTTDENGETDPIELPTVSRERSLRPEEEGQVAAGYYASIEAPGYVRQDIYNVEIFDGITSVQHVNLQPATGSSGAGPAGTGISRG